MKLSELLDVLPEAKKIHIAFYDGREGGEPICEKKFLQPKQKDMENSRYILSIGLTHTRRELLCT